MLEQAYREIRERETNLALPGLHPAEAIRQLVIESIDHHDRSPDFVRLVCIENIPHGRYLKGSEAIRTLNTSVLEVLADIVARGRAMGVFTRDVDIRDLHLLISAVSFYRLGNRYTFGTLFGLDLAADEVVARHKTMLIEAVFGVLGYQGG